MSSSAARNESSANWEAGAFNITHSCCGHPFRNRKSRIPGPNEPCQRALLSFDSCRVLGSNTVKVVPSSGPL